MLNGSQSVGTGSAEIVFRNSLKEAVETSNYNPAKDFPKYTVRYEASDFAVSMLMDSNHTLWQGGLS